VIAECVHCGKRISVLDELEESPVPPECEECAFEHGSGYCPDCGSCGVYGCCMHYCDRCRDRYDEIGEPDVRDCGDMSHTRGGRKG
jgi:hypothetical protein